LIVLGTSALVEFLAGKDELAEKVRAVLMSERLAAPHVVDLECASTMRGLVRAGKLPEDEARRALDLLGEINLTRYDHVPLLPRIWQLRHNMWPYDAAYVALAESLRTDLFTVDAKLAGVPGVSCVVRNLRDD
jgi:predicted nucleic acid-binding protein